MLKNETLRPCLIQKLKWRMGKGWGHDPLAPSPPVATPLQVQLLCFSPTANYNRCVRSRPVKSSCDAESMTVFYRFLQVSRFVEIFSQYWLLSFLKQSLVRKLLHPLYKTYSFDVLRSQFTIHDPTIHFPVIHDSCIN